MEHETATAYGFGPFLLIPAERRLLKNGTAIDLTVKTFDLLVLLVKNAGGLVSKDKILDTVWGVGVYVDESNLTTTISMLRKALGQTDQELYIETVPRKGYRFVAAVSTSASSAPHRIDNSSHSRILAPQTAKAANC
jgi:DNA-binding winged helix-turn-helix (wHTH) protein